MVQINFIEYSKIWKEYYATINVSKEDSEALEKGEVTLGNLVSKYNCEYGDSEDLESCADSETEYELVDMEVM